MAANSLRARGLTAFSVLALLVAGHGDAFSDGESFRKGSSGADIGILAVPEGITLEPLGVSQGYQSSKLIATRPPRDEIAFADPRGMTLYTYVPDPLGQFTCVAECAQVWRPALAPAKPKPIGDWSVIPRDQGAKQWAYKGKALYTYVKDIDPGSVYGNSPARFGGKRKNGAGEVVGGIRRAAAVPDVPLPPEWKVALFYPVSGIKLPAGFGVKEVQDATSLVLVNHRNMTLYTFAGEPKRDKRQNSPWLPAEAPQLSDPIGDFNFVVRDDGIKQWTYKGKGLYTCAFDLAPDDAHGIGVDKQWDVAALYRYYNPPTVTIQNTPTQGKVLATANGLTLYRREAHIVQSGGGHGFRRGSPLRPAVGRDIGIAHVGCDGECRKIWHPYRAPDDATAWGQWTVITHPDDFRQWVYQGYSLWTYDGDKKPGDITGHDRYDLLFADKPDAPAAQRTVIDIGTPQDGAAGLYWMIAIP